jgi:ABC-type lipoprotein release transport system permease subunit
LLLHTFRRATASPFSALLALVIIAGLATLLPARGAARVNSLTALRVE